MEVDMEIKSSNSYYYYGQPLIPQKSNLILQMLLQANAYVSILWSVSYLLHLCFWSHLLWNYTGLAMLLAYVLAVGTEWLRLYASYSINLTTNATTMWLFLTLTPCVLLPALVYLRLAVVYANLWLHLLSHAQFVLIGLEALTALICHVCSLATDKRNTNALKSNGQL
ncbi:PREDICTED: uncharacterized protein LOC108619280 [Drosophila arizonae]|uniref:Uncharacterized protein LOC108619280 n=1 Tax=Drosophila arizonae TaxID=7263 RepID=A0ABM1PVP9_DROAR|nr:PREDICTED: uncharacterized protein LOC108619280 [Drosophila arizonae]